MVTAHGIEVAWFYRRERESECCGTRMEAAEEAAATKEEEEEEGGGWWVVDDGVQCMTRARLRQKVLGQTSHNARARVCHAVVHLMGRGTRGLGFSFQRF